MQGGVCKPCGLLFYVCWIIKNRYMLLKRDLQMIIELTIYVPLMTNNQLLVIYKKPF